MTRVVLTLFLVLPICLFVWVAATTPPPAPWDPTPVAVVAPEPVDAGQVFADHYRALCHELHDEMQDRKPWTITDGEQDFIDHCREFQVYR